MKSAFAASLDFHSLDRAFLSPRKVPRSGLQWGRRRGEATALMVLALQLGT